MIKFSEYIYLNEERLDKTTLSKIVEDDYNSVKEATRKISPEAHEKLRLAVEEYKRAMEVAKRYYGKVKKGEENKKDE
jgi:hypothetical protein